MKKLLIVTTALMAAALFFAGCSNPSGSSASTDPNNQNNSGTTDQTDSLPGTWVKNLENFTTGTSGNWTNNGNKVSFKCSDPASLNIPKGYETTYTRAISQTQLYGVRARIKQDAFTKAEPGLILFLKTSEDDSDRKSVV